METPPRLFEVPENAGLPEAWEEPRLETRFDFQSLATAEGAEFKWLALQYVLKAGGLIARSQFEIDGFPVDAEVRSQHGQRFLLLARGTPDRKERSGFRRTDTVQKAGFVAMNLARSSEIPLLLITSDLPDEGSKARTYLRSLSDVVWDCMALRGDLAGFQRLSHYMTSQPRAKRLQAPWKADTRKAEHAGQQELELDPVRTLRSVDRV